ncbi:MAG: hypothetical protein R2784_16125 [Saprospiraceae bacterium]
MKYFFPLIFLFALILSCAPTENEQSSNTVASKPQKSPEQIKKELLEKLGGRSEFSAGSLDTIPGDMMFEMWDEIGKVEVFLYNQDYNMTLGDTNSSRTILKMISTEPAGPILNCPAEGRLFFHDRNNDDVIIEADLHYANGGCNYLVFYKDGQALYANNLTIKGTDYFGNYLSKSYKQVSEQELKESKGKE